MDQLNIRELERIVRDGQHKPIDLPDGSKVVLVPSGTTAQRLDPTEQTLFRIRQKPSLYDTESFIAYVNRYKTDATRLFAKTAPSVLTAILDYHAAADEGKAGSPDHAAHVATYAPKYSDEWKAWTEAAKAPMTQVEFAEFIEEHRRDIRAPDAAALLDMVTNFKAKKSQDFNSIVHLRNGNVKLGWTDETTPAAGSGAGMEVPEQLKIGIPVFFKGPMFEIGVFLRYRVDRGVLAFSLKIDRPDYVETTAFDDIVNGVAEATAIEVYQGSAN